MKELLQKIQDILRDAKLPKTISYVCVCKAGVVQNALEMDKPVFLRRLSPINIWLMPEVAAGFSNREALDKACAEIEAKLNECVEVQLGKSYTVGVVPTKNTMLLNDGYFVTIKN